MDNKDKYKDCVKIDLSKIPEHVKEDLARTVYHCVKDFFENITPEQQARFEQWCEEYHRKQKASDDVGRG